jgi:hypothetical protein
MIKGRGAHCEYSPNLMIGRQFGNWTVLSLHPVITYGKGKLYLCRCVCGNTKIKLGTALRRDKSKRCVECRNNPDIYSKEMIEKLKRDTEFYERQY